MKPTKNAALSRRPARGQGMTEYIIIVSLIAIAAIGVITLFGDNIRSLFSASAQALGGNTNVTNQALSSVPDAMRKKDLSNAFQNNGY